jgi:hypothetical protein
MARSRSLGLVARAAKLAGLAVLVCGVASVSACDKSPSKAELASWRSAAQDLNDAALSAHKSAAGDAAWSLDVSGQLTGGHVRLDWARIEQLATVHVKTRAPHHTSNPQEVIDWRGIPVGVFLESLGAAPSSETVTFIGSDFFSVTLDYADLRKWPNIILAVEQDGKPIKRSEAGPIVLVFPYTDSPDVAKKYNELFWAFYVAHVVVDHDDIALRIGTKTLDRAALDKLPRVALDGTVGFRIHWPSGKTAIQGVRLFDALAAAGVAAPDGSKVVIRSKTPALREDAHEMTLDAADLRTCEIMLALTFGAGSDRAAIPASMGGPVGLGLGPKCRDKYDKGGKNPWPVYVQEIEVVEP